MDNWELDRAWLLNEMPNATENQIDIFCEKTALFWIEGLSDADSRGKALNIVLNKN